MIRACTSTIAIACAMLAAGCSHHSSPVDSSAGVAKAATLPAAAAAPAAPAAPATPNYALPNGKPDYVALKRDFGAPNTNLDLNPKAIDVAKTASRGNVTVEPTKLIFTGPHSAWLGRLDHTYTLYCSSACGGDGFVRNITAIRRQGQRWVVSTETGSVSDVVRRGWLHAEVPMLDRRTKKHPHYEYQKTFQLVNQSKTQSVPFSVSHVTGTATGTLAFNANVAIDIVVVNPITNGLSNTLQTFSDILTATPSFTATFDATASGDYTWDDANLFSPVSFPLGEFQAGPVPIIMTLVVSASAHADASASVNLHYTANGALQGQTGFTYTSANGLQDNTGFQPSFSQSATVAGNAEAHAYVELDSDIQFKVFGAGGPDIKVAGQLGIEASASAKAGFDGSKSTCSCQYDVQGDIYFQLTGSVGLVLAIPHIKTFTAGPVQIAQQKWPLVSYEVGSTQPDGSHDKKRHDCQASTGDDAGTSSDGGSCTPAGTASVDGTCDDCCVPGSCDANQVCSAAGGTNPDGGANGMCTPSGTASTDGTCDDCCTPGSCDASQICTDDPDAGPASNCPDGQQDCGDGQGCHDLSVDAANCGTCNTSCTDQTGSATSTCVASTCNCLCPDGMTACPDGQNGSSCTSTTTCPDGMGDCDQSGQCAFDITGDPNNCGACGTVCGGGSVCPTGLTCVSSQCMCSDGVTACSDTTCANCPDSSGQGSANCPQGMLDCDGSGQCATDGTSDPSNCGGCSNQDPNFDCSQTTGSTTSTCNSGTCSCLCSDGMTPCPDGQNSSSCTSQCAAGTDDCTGDGSCDTDLTSDPSNCNACGQACQSGFCVSSQCACDASGTPACPDGTCGNPDTNSDATHCGSSCVDCTQQTGSSTSQCQDGSCVCLCSDGQTACPDGQNASSCDQGTTCSDGQQDCNGDGNCEDLSSDPNNCNSCGNACPSQFCVGGACVCDANGTPTCGDNGTCPDYTSDNNNCGSCGNDCTQAQGDGQTGPEATCQNSNCTCSCTCGDGSACPNCDSGQCSSGSGGGSGGNGGNVRRPRH